MLQQLKTKQEPNSKQQTSRVPGTHATITYGRGVEKGNPKRCLHCQKPIRKGEAWEKHTSAFDAEVGQYSVIVHARCDPQKGKH